MAHVIIIGDPFDPVAPVAVCMILRVLSLVQSRIMATLLAAPDNAATMSPAEARALFRLNKYYGSTTGFCAGYTQANVTILPKSLAKDYTEFCRKNHATLPLLYSSEPGEVTTSLATGSDVRSGHFMNSGCE